MMVWSGPIQIFLTTMCAGEIAAVPNTYCAVGVAYGAKVSGNGFSFVNSNYSIFPSRAYK